MLILLLHFIFRLGKLITMAGLDASDSVFNTTSRDLPKFNRSFAKSNGFSGDISSDGQINGSFNVGHKPTNGNIRPRPYLTSNATGDPTMKNSSYLDDSHDEAQRRRDELYERILQETSNAFRNIGEQDLTINITGDTTRMQDESADSRRFADLSKEDLDLTPLSKSPDKTPTQKSRIPRPGNKKGAGDSDNEQDRSRSEHMESMKGPGGEIIMTLSPFEDEADDKSGMESPDRHGDAYDSRVASPSKGRASDFSYGMESFEQSYVSERGELVHLGDDDFFPDSPSPNQQQSDNEEF